jgi:lauroyl/myristoyl acyltransferase
MGNYDLAAPLFSSRFGRTIYAVRAPERQPEMQAIRERELRRKEAEHPQFRALYNTSDNHLGIVLANLLTEGNIVAVQGDRVVFDVSPMEVTLDDGLVMRLPKGPLYLARATGASCFPLFIVRDGWRRYRVKVFPPLALPPRRRGEDSEAAKIWAEAILRVVRPHWAQWFVFEPMLRRADQG